jgi:hypothetical protein
LGGFNPHNSTEMTTATGQTDQSGQYGTGR